MRARLGQDLFTYLHFPIIAGIILTALGVEQAMGHLDDAHLGTTGGWALGCGVALFLAGTAATATRSTGNWLISRTVAIALLVAVSPLLTRLAALAAVVLPAAAQLALAAADASKGSSVHRAGRVGEPGS